VKRTALAALAAATLLAACGSKSSGPGEKAELGPNTQLDRITLVLDWTPNTNHNGIYLAKAKGWYRDAGIDVHIIQPGQSGSVQALGAGKADVAITVSEELLPARAQGADVVSIAAILQHNTSSLVALADSGIKGPADLPGHTYGGYGGQLEDALVKKLATCAGADASKIKFEQVGNVDYLVGLQRHHFDFVWLFDGWDVIRMRDLEHAAVTTIPFIDHTDCIPDWYTPIIATSGKMIAKQPALLRRFMQVTRRGYREAMAHPDEASAALLKGAPELDQQLVDLSSRYLASRYADDPSAWGRQDLAVWSRFATFLRQAGLLDKPVDVNKAFTNRFLE
jgi:ABC-type nitrate/sulfonate/bicarbonate transport system substrate-binding protein